MSGTARVYNIISLFSTSIVPAKILLQELWKLDLAWDRPIPSQLADQYRDWIQKIPSLTSHPVPRRLSSSDLPVIFTSLHGFSDASQLAYGAAVYLRRIHADNSTHCTLLSVKSRVMLLKALTISIELQAALLLTKLLIYLASPIQVPIQDCYAWSDSQIVLHWLNKPPSKLQQFVLNRVKNITEFLPASHWRFVRSQANPADLASRGLPPQELLSSKLWWHGPAETPSRLLAVSAVNAVVVSHALEVCGFGSWKLKNQICGKMADQ